MMYSDIHILLNFDSSTLTIFACHSVFIASMLLPRHTASMYAMLSCDTYADRAMMSVN